MLSTIIIIRIRMHYVPIIVATRGHIISRKIVVVIIATTATAAALRIAVIPYMVVML